MINDKNIKAFIAYLEKRRCTEATVNTYRIVLTSFIKVDLKAFFETSDDAPATLHKKKAVVDSFYAFLKRKGKAVSTPLGDIVLPRIPQSLAKAVPEDKINRIIRSIPTVDFPGVRDKALFELGYAIAARRSDLRSAMVHDLDMNSCTLIVTGKGNKEMLKPFGRCAHTALKRYLPLRNDRARTDALFISDRGKQLALESINYIVRKYTDIPPHVLFRHSCATHLLNAGMRIEDVSEILGHSSIQTTQRYAKVAYKRLKSVYDNVHPRAGQEVS